MSGVSVGYLASFGLTALGVNFWPVMAAIWFTATITVIAMAALNERPKPPAGPARGESSSAVQDLGRLP